MATFLLEDFGNRPDSFRAIHDCCFNCEHHEFYLNRIQDWCYKHQFEMQFPCHCICDDFENEKTTD